MRATGLEWVMTQRGGAPPARRGWQPDPGQHHPLRRTPPHTSASLSGELDNPPLRYQHGRLHRPQPSASPRGAGQPHISITLQTDPHRQHHPPDRPPPHQHHQREAEQTPISITSGDYRDPPTHTSTAPEQITPHHHRCQGWWTDPSPHQHHHQGAQQPPLTTRGADWPHLLPPHPPFPASLGEQPDPPQHHQGGTGPPITPGEVC